LRVARATLAASLLVATAAPAFAQYRTAGTGFELFPSRKDQLTKASEAARWTLGPLRVAPWLGLRDVTYVREQAISGGESRGDLTAPAGAGLKVYVPLGTHGMFSAHALPEYTWWRRQSDRNAVVGHYAVGAFLWGNRIEGEVTGRRAEEVTFLSSDLLVREPVRDDNVAAQAQIRLFGSIGAFVSGNLDRVRVNATSGLEPDDPAFLLDRDEDQVRAGARWLLRGERGYFGAGALQERTKFNDLAASVRSNKGSSWYGEVVVRGNHLDVNANVAQRDLKADGSTFPGYHGLNGNAAVILHPGWRVHLTGSAVRQLRYSALDIDRYVEEQRTGVSLNSAIGDGSLQLFYETGRDKYFGAPATPAEDVDAYGASIEVRLFRYLSARVGSRRTHFSVPGGTDRTLREVTGALSLTLGQPGEW
jgi:hypothetical protein